MCANDNLIQIRKGLRESQADFAKRLGIKRATLGAYEEKRAKVPVDIVQKIFNDLSIPKQRMYDFYFEPFDITTVHIEPKQTKPLVEIKTDGTEVLCNMNVNLLEFTKQHGTKKLLHTVNYIQHQIFQTGMERGDFETEMLTAQ